MYQFPYPSYLRTHRKKWGLTLAELGQFLGLSESGVSKYENLARDPGRDTLIAAELVFGVPARKLFPGLYAPIEREMLARVAALAEALQDDGSKEAAAKRELLEQIAVRLAGEQTSI